MSNKYKYLGIALVIVGALYLLKVLIVGLFVISVTCVATLVIAKGFFGKKKPPYYDDC